MAHPIRPTDGKDDPPPPFADQTDTPTLLTQAVRLAVGFGMLPLIGIGLLAKNTTRPNDMTRRSGESDDAPPPTSPQPQNDDRPNQADVEAALRKLTAATIPRNRSPKNRPRK